MASLALGLAGEALGPSLFGSGIAIGDLTLSGAQIGGALGALAGSEIDALIAPGVRRQGPRLATIAIQGSSETAPVPQVFGRMRVAGQLIWATNFKETALSSQSGGGKGFGGAATSTTEYSYSISFALGLCVGEIEKIGRIWADGRLIDPALYTMRVYQGGESQLPDPLIEEVEGTGNTPAYRGLAYVVFEDMPLADFGNRIPQLNFEIIRTMSNGVPDTLEQRLRGICLIPGAGEFAYATTVEHSDDGRGGTMALNAHCSATSSDLSASLDELAALAPNLEYVSLVVGWFGLDLRAGMCRIMPGVEIAQKTTYPDGWAVNGVGRDMAHVVSSTAGRPNYGGTPSDASVIAAITDLRRRGRSVMFNPFLFMDIVAGNMLPDPLSGVAPQPAFPWRGRITGSFGSAGTAAAAAEVAAFFGAARPGDFSLSASAVAYHGPAEWSYRRMVLHCAMLCRAAGGVDAFLIGSELVGLTQLRDATGGYPAVSALKALASDVRQILGPHVRIGYAADWSEYNNHQLGGGAVIFNLDPLWSDPDIDFIGIDNYLPVSDWRDGSGHLDYRADGPRTIYDTGYLSSNIRSGEFYDWYYASAADRDAQIRTPITDGAGKPWVWRAKDIWSWWSNSHFDRPEGRELAAPTTYVARSKPIWFCELGCPAVDKGANQPNVFYDPKSAESALPYQSNGARDDLIQRRFLEAHLGFWADPANNPVSPVYGGPMVDRIHVWCWDARPFPFFPALSGIWGDAANYRLGHWLNGRLGAVRLADLASALCGAVPCDVSGLSALVSGYAVTQPMSVRDALAPLASAYAFDAVESGGLIRFVARGASDPVPAGEGDLVLAAQSSDCGFTLKRAQETDLPQCVRVAYIDPDTDFQPASAAGRRLATGSAQIADLSLPMVLDQGEAIAIAERLMMEGWLAREESEFTLPPSFLALDPADEIALTAGGRTRRYRISAISDAGGRSIKAVATDPSVYEPFSGPARQISVMQSLAPPGRPILVLLDLPWLKEGDAPFAPYAAAMANPWVGPVLLFKSASSDGFNLAATLNRAATIGETTAAFYQGPWWRLDWANTLRVRFYGGEVSSASAINVFAGANALALQQADGDWEIVQFLNANLTGPGEWSLTGLLRGQGGTEAAMSGVLAPGARVVLLDQSLVQVKLAQSEALLPLKWTYGPEGRPLSDPSYQNAAPQFVARGLQPFAPCQLSAVYAANGNDLLLSWLRRDRDPSADSWDIAVPMSESSECYDVEILDAEGRVKRTFSSLTAANVTYAANQIAADFPAGIPHPFRYTVYQCSAATGRGKGGTAAFFFS